MKKTIKLTNKYVFLLFFVAMASMAAYVFSLPIWESFSAGSNFADSNDAVLLAGIIKPILEYANADTQKMQILKDNKNKSGIYMWKNKINEKIYIGSSVNIRRRLAYFNINYLQRTIKRNKSIICNSLLHNGYSNFQLAILEYCDPKNCLEREQYYIDLLKPDYNILTKAGSRLGYSNSGKKIEEAQPKLPLKTYWKITT